MLLKAIRKFYPVGFRRWFDSLLMRPRSCSKRYLISYLATSVHIHLKVCRTDKTKGKWDNEIERVLHEIEKYTIIHTCSIYMYMILYSTICKTSCIVVHFISTASFIWMNNILLFNDLISFFFLNSIFLKFKL